MARVAADFTHFDRSFEKGEKVPDDDPLVVLAPHLFVQPKTADDGHKKGAD